MKRNFLCACYVAIAALAASAQEANDIDAGSPASDYVLNVKDVDIHAFADEVSTVTGRTLILDPAVSGEVTVMSREPLDADGIWELFQGVLRVNGYAAVQTGPGWRIIPQADAQRSGPFSRSWQSGGGDLVTQLVVLDGLSATEAAGILEPFLPRIGSVDAFPQSNALLITGYAEDVDRLAELIFQIEQAEGSRLEAIPLQYGLAGDIGDLISRLQNSGEAFAPRIVADPRSNQLLVRGNSEQIAEVRRIAATLDTPEGSATQTRVFRLANSDAESIANVLQGLAGTSQQATNPVARNLRDDRRTTPARRDRVATLQDNPATGGYPEDGETSGLSDARMAGAASSAGFATDDVAIQTATDINAIVVRGAPGTVAEIADLIEELDVRRPQVMIEAAIVEITGDAAEQFGVQLGLGNAAPEGGVAAVSFADQGLSLRRILSFLGTPAALGITENGLSLGISAEDEFGILVQAFGSSSKANLLSTPSLTTLDNAPAEIVVGQNVPFRTGSFTTTGNSTNPFTTIEREDVGITLSVLPRIFDGDVVRLDVVQEVSSLANASVPGASDIITNRRSIQTTVLADNGGTVALGGLITDDRMSIDSKVPVIGDVPVVGNLFKNTTETGTRRTLFVFLRPVILRSRSEVNAAAEARYDTLRRAEQQLGQQGSLLLDERTVRLPESVEGIY